VKEEQYFAGEYASHDCVINSTAFGLKNAGTGGLVDAGIGEGDVHSRKGAKGEEDEKAGTIGAVTQGQGEWERVAVRGEKRKDAVRSCT